MADIDIERKGPGIWPWIIGLLVLALVAWLLVEALADDDEAVEQPVAAVTEPAPPPADPVATAPAAAGAAGAAALPAAAQEYMTTCAPREPGSMALDHQYTSDCIRRLVASVEAMVRQPGMAGVDVQAQLADARQRAERLVQTPETSAEHAGMTREAFTSLAALLGTVQDQRYPAMDGQATRLEQTAGSVQPSRPLLDQREAVQDFLRQAGDLLQGMADAQPAA
ncbi:MAG: hypothetical protein AB1941_17930 [Gemmatimonadota bacterium]